MMKPLLLILTFSLSWPFAFGEKALPKISPESMEKIQRLVLFLHIIEYPQPQGALVKYLKPYEDMGGGSNRGDVAIALTDTRDPVGYYGINLYFGDTQPGEKNIPLIARTEIFFQPVYSEKFLTLADQFILKTSYSQKTIEGLRALMHALKRTPGEFVQQLDENGLPSDQMLKELEALSVEKPASEKALKK